MKPRIRIFSASRRRALPALILITCASSALGQEATTAEWYGSEVDLNWNTADNWEPIEVPGSGSNAALLYDPVVLDSPAVADLGQLLIKQSAILDVSSTIGIAGTGGLYVGAEGSAGTLNILSGGALTHTGGECRIGNVTTGTLTLDAGGSMSVTGGAMNVGREGGGNGQFTQTDGVFSHTTGDFLVGAFGANGVCDISGGTTAINSLRLSFAGSGTGEINQDGGAVTLSGEPAIGWANSGDATYNLSGGTVTTGNRMRFGIGNAVRTNLFNQTGGAVLVNGRVDIGEAAGPTNIYQISAGSLTLSGTNDILVGAFNDGTGRFDVSGTAEVTTTRLLVGALGTSSGVVNLTGGKVTVREITSGSTAPVQELNLDGGTIAAKEGTGNMISGANLVVDIKAGGGTIDSNGFPIAIQKAMGGVGALTKAGSNQLTLTGDNTYSGGTTVTGGILSVGTDAQLGDAVTPSNLTLDGGALKNNGIDLELSANRTVVLADASWGALVAGWGKTVSVAGQVTGGGELRISNDGGPVRLDNPANDYTGNTVIGDYATGYPLGTSARMMCGADEVIPDGSLVEFNGGLNSESNPVTGELDLNGKSETVAGLSRLSGNARVTTNGGPASLTVGASDTTSSFDGVIQNDVAITKIGSGTLTLSGANSYSGVTTVDAGLLEVSGTAIPNGGKLVINGGQVAPTGTEVVDTLFFGGVQQDAGTWGADGSGATNTDARFSGIDGVISVTTGPSAGGDYDSWATDKGLTGANNGATVDAENDGIDNLLEYVLVGDPLASDTEILPALSLDTDDFIFTFLRSDDSETDTTQTFQYGSDLDGWVDVAIGATSGGQVEVIENGAGPDTIIVTIPRTEEDGGKLFGRLQAVQP